MSARTFWVKRKGARQPVKLSSSAIDVSDLKEDVKRKLEITESLDSFILCVNDVNGVVLNFELSNPMAKVDAVLAGLGVVNTEAVINVDVILPAPSDIATGDPARGKGGVFLKGVILYSHKIPVCPFL